MQMIHFSYDNIYWGLCISAGKMFTVPKFLLFKDSNSAMDIGRTSCVKSLHIS